MSRTARQSLSPAQLEKQLIQGTVAPLYAVLGEEDLLRDQAVATLRTCLLEAGGGDFNCDLFYGDEAEGSAIMACASEAPVFAPRRLVIVKAADKLPARHADTLLPYLKAPNSTTTLVFVAAKLDGRLKFTQALLQASVVVACEPLTDSYYVPWLKQEAERLGVRLSDDALQVLREASGGSLYGARREVEKLAAYVPADRAATPEDVLAMRGMEPGASVFDLAAAIGRGQRGRALAIVARNIEAGEAPLKILGSLAWQYRRIWKVKDQLRHGGREGEAARTLRMDPYQVRPFLDQFSDAHLRRALQAFQESDASLKGGSAGRPPIILDRLVFQLCERKATDSRPDSTGPKTGSPARGPARTKPVSNVRTITRGTPPRS
ncbi:MAG TPA: DNA polymerase III subunit delta [Nitrospira sp.]|nr:DNA polymerase III subunit delta [Nitrospira sp.]